MNTWWCSPGTGSGQLALLNPNVRETAIEIGPIPSWDAQVAETLLEYFPQLEEAYVGGSNWMPLLSKYPHLKTLRLCYLTHVYAGSRRSSGHPFAPGSKMPEFKVHYRFNQDGGYSHPVPISPSPFCLPALQVLNIECDELGHAPYIFPSMQLPALRTLSYAFDPNVFKNHLDVPLRAIATAFPHLTTLKLSVVSSKGLEHVLYRAAYPQPPSITSISQRVRLGEMLAPLAPLRDLSALRIIPTDIHFDYGGADLLAIAAAWPALLELKIVVDQVGDTDGLGAEVASLDVLAELARACAGLRVLHLPRTLIVPDALAAALAEITPHHALRDLALGCGEVLGGQDLQEAKRTGRAFLRELFPDAKLVAFS
ncbi:uncharacterized protein BXZ73DRAFT_106401 [Epithele typhae]|uniref:uncharacterized protein n=1 Tax=Epithele typhae TaxID=378194 RepID=UPI002008B82E|nr:uncharacterized protein BXZ73DRAFT_106401 [Epithele typhae]KAH9914893.1 hypothetical protein BXZ73DRAFT_106401 [Epithele typhae]